MLAIRGPRRPLRADEVAGWAAVDRATANRYLTYLCEQGIADRSPEHGKQGHPPYLYTLLAAWEVFPDPAHEKS